jgi:glyoxylase-like metal-dependent hydrolase (beta-lactamase superfamily II)
MVGHVTSPPAALLTELPAWVTLVRAPNPGPMTLDGTNTWVLRVPDAEHCVVVDPGPLVESHLAALMAHAPVAAILVTHGHPDHIEAVASLSERLGGVPVSTGGLDLSPYGLSVQAMATPGHTSDSVCFLAEAAGSRAVLTGDTILGRGTTVVAYPDGDLGAYLDSLRRLAQVGPLPVLPGHGPALADCSAAAQFYLEHRLARLEQVRDAVARGAADAPEVVAMVYADVDRSLWWAAELSVRAQLAYLNRDSRESGDPASRLDPP